MKRNLLLLLGLSIIFFTTTLHAGVEPSPFQPEINQLGAVENGLSSCLGRVQKVLAVPPNPVLPSPNVNGAVNRLEAINGQVTSLNDFIANTINSVMGVEPSPFRVDLIPALEVVGIVSQDIAKTIENFIRVPPNPIIPEFEVALLDVKSSADSLTDTVWDGIAELSGAEGTCFPYDSTLGCDVTRCDLTTDDAGVNTCCCFSQGY